jgi:dihydroorotase
MTTLSKYLYLGLSLDQAIELGTTKPARAVRLDENIGTLRVGADADISIIQLREGPVTLTDARGATRQGKQLLVPVETLRAGRRFSPQHSVHPHLIGHLHRH